MTDEDDEAHKKVAKAMAMVALMSPLMHDKGPTVQGLVITQLLGLFLSGWPKDLRRDEGQRILETATDLAAANEAITYGAAGHPYNNEPKPKIN